MLRRTTVWLDSDDLEKFNKYCKINGYKAGIGIRFLIKKYNESYERKFSSEASPSDTTESPDKLSELGDINHRMGL